METIDRGQEGEPIGEPDHRQTRWNSAESNGAERSGATYPLSLQRVTSARGPIGWWYGGMVIDLIHMPIVLALVALGASKWNGPVYVGIISAIVIMQVAFLGCPVLAFTTWMKRKYDPDFPGGWSFTVWLYHRYGRLAGIAVFVFFLVAAIVVRIVAF